MRSITIGYRTIEMATPTSYGTTELPRNIDSTSSQSKIGLYIGVSVAVGVFICVLFVVCILVNRKGRFQMRRKSVRQLLVRGFSMVSQRGVLDSTGEFEMVNTSATVSLSSEDGHTANGRGRKSSNDKKLKSTPKKPDRRRRKSSSTTKYENVTLDPNAGFIVRKSISMSSEIPYIDSGTLDPKLTAECKEDELDDVFQ